MNSDIKIVSTPKTTSTWRWLASVIIIALMAGFAAAQTHVAQTNAISMDLLDRWYQVTAGEFSGEMAEWISEGHQILDQIRQLETLKDQALAQAPKTLAEIESLRNQFIDLLKMVERARIAQMSPQELQNMRLEYLAERERELQFLNEGRKALIARGEAFLQEIDTNEFLTRHPQQAQVLEDFLFRLGELYYQDSGAEFLLAFDNWNQLAKEARAKGEPVPDAPQPDYSRAENTYLRILNEYPHGKHVDACLFNLAKIYESQDDPATKEKVIEYYRRLVRSFPDSPYLAMVYIGIGDYYFFKDVDQPEDLESNMQQAIEAYRMVLSTPDTLYFNDAYFKIGWSNYRISKYANAVKAFTQCIETTLALKDQLDPSEYSSFYQKSIKYLALLFTSEKWGEGGLDNAAKYVQDDAKRRDTYGEAVIHKMGEIHAQIYEWIPAIAAYDLYLRFYPLNRDAVVVHEQKLIALEEADMRAAEERDLFLDLYGPGSAWRNANPDPELAVQVDSKREMFLFKSTDEITTKAVQTADPQDLEEAISFCHRYLNTFPDSDRACQVRMNLAMMLYSPPIERFWDAYQQFIFYCWQYDEDIERRETAAKNAVAAAYAIAEAERAGSMTFSQDQRAEILQNVVIHSDFDSLYPNWYNNLTTSEILYCEALDTYLNIYPMGDVAPQFLWRVGKLFFDNAQYPMSRYWLVQVEDRFADLKEEVQESNKLILNGYILEKDYTGIETRARHILSLDVEPEFRESVRIRLAEAIFQSAEALREQARQSQILADHQPSGLEFERVALEVPDFKYADASLFNAGLELAEARDFEGAVDAYTLLEEQYPQSEYLDRALYNHAYILGAELSRHEEAAQVNMRLFEKYPNSPLRSDALYNASQSYVQAGNATQAIQVSKTFAATYPTSVEARSLLLGAAVMLGQAEDQEGASQVYAEFAQEYPDDPNVVRAYHERGKHFEETGDNQSARREFQMAADAYKSLSAKGIEGIEDVRPLASKSLYAILKWDFQTYKDIELAPRSRLTAQIDEKKRQSESLVKGYDQLIAWSEAEAIMAMVRRADVLDEYATSYRNQAPPTDPNPVSRGEKILQIARDALGYQELAIEEYLKVLGELPNTRNVLNERRQTAPEDEQFALDTLITSINNREDYCRGKYMDLRIGNADNLNTTLAELLNIQGFEKYGTQTRLKRQFTFWNTQLLPVTLEALSLYQLAVHSSDSLFGQGNDYERRSLERSISTVQGYLEHGQNLARKALSAYRGTVGDYGNVLPRGDQATYKGLEASDFAALADDFNKKANIYAQATISSGRDLIDWLREHGFNKNRTAPLEDLVTAFVVEYASLSEENTSDAEKGLTSSRAGFAEQQTIVYEDAMFVFEQWILVWSQYRLDILKIGHQFVEKFSIVSNDADQILEKLAALEPDNYGKISPDSPER